MILREHKVVAMAVDNVLNMDVATKKLKIMKCGCFTHILHPGSTYTIATFSRWHPRLVSLIQYLTDVISGHNLRFSSSVE